MNVNRSKKENDFTLKRTRSRQYPTETLIDADYADDLVLLANIPDQTKSLMHSLEQAAGGIGSNMNADKTEFIMSFKQDGALSTLSGKPLKFVEKFTYLISNISSTKSNVNIS